MSKNSFGISLKTHTSKKIFYWNSNARYRLFDNILPNPAVKMFRISNSYTDSCVEERNRILVERADVVLAVNNGYTLSDVGSIIRKAKKRNREVLKVAVHSLIFVKHLKPENSIKNHHISFDMVILVFI